MAKAPAVTVPVTLDPAGLIAMADLIVRHLSALRDDLAKGTTEACCCCGSRHVCYRNHLEQPFCWPCANGDCLQAKKQAEPPRNTAIRIAREWYETLRKLENSRPVRASWDDEHPAVRATWANTAAALLAQQVIKP